MSLSVYLTCPCCKEIIFHESITHNLGLMAEAIGIYEFLWRPEELKITKASQLIKPLKMGIRKLESNPARYRELNSPNKWGGYVDFLPFVKRYWKACVRNPNALIEVWR